MSESRLTPVLSFLVALMLSSALSSTPSGRMQESGAAASSSITRKSLEAAIEQERAAAARTGIRGGGAAALSEAFLHATAAIPLLYAYRVSGDQVEPLDLCTGCNPADALHYPNFQEYASGRVRGIPSDKASPGESSRRLSAEAEAIERAIGEAETSLNPDDLEKLAPFRRDLLAVASLGLYEARRILTCASLALYYSSGAESALRSAEAHAAAALEIRQRLVSLSEEPARSNALFGPECTERWKDDLISARADVRRLKEVRALFERYGLFDLGLNFGAGVPADGESLYAAGQRFLPLGPQTSYSSRRGYGWRDAQEIRSSEQSGIASKERGILDDPSLHIGAQRGTFLRGLRKSTLLIDLPGGAYRITSMVDNTPELASGRFQIRVAGRDTGIVYQAGEPGDKSIDVRVTGGQLALDFIPETGNDWLVSGLVITRHTPHISHVPLMAVTAGTRSNLTATITAPDEARSAYVEMTVPSQARPVTVVLVSDQSEFSAVLEWRPGWSGREVHYHITAEDQAGNIGRLPEKGDFTLKIEPGR